MSSHDRGPIGIDADGPIFVLGNLLQGGKASLAGAELRSHHGEWERKDIARPEGDNLVDDIRFPLTRPQPGALFWA